MSINATRGFTASLADRWSVTKSERLDTEELYHSTEPSLKRNLKWALYYVIYASIFWFIIAASFFCPTKAMRLAACDQTSACMALFPIWKYIGVGISIFNIGLLWLYLAIYKSINIGILFFFFNIVNGEVAYYCMARRYSYKLNPRDDCLECAGYINNTIWDFGLYSIWFHVILQWLFSCSRSCFNQCRIGKILYRCCGQLTVILTYICIIWIICVYLYISVHLAADLKHERDYGVGIIIVLFCMLFVILGMFPFPFCTELTIQLVEGWKNKCKCCNKDHSINTYKPYSETFGVDEEKRANLLSTE